jgi:hypothetical protein
MPAARAAPSTTSEVRFGTHPAHPLSGSPAGPRAGATCRGPPLLRRRTARRAAAVALLLAIAGSACAGGNAGSGAAASLEPKSFAVYALSRGRGVPEGARAALTEAERVIEGLRAGGADVAVTEERIGLEGETRLCFTFADPGLAEEALERIRRLASGVDLVNLAEEPCGGAARR